MIIVLIISVGEPCRDCLGKPLRSSGLQRACVCVYVCAWVCVYIYIYIYTERERDRETERER